MIGRKFLYVAAVIQLLLPTRSFAAERAFLKVETANADRMEAWYSHAFGLKRVNLFKRPTFDQRILMGRDIIAELVQSQPPATASQGTRLGIAKAGFEVEDFDRKLAAWRAAGTAPSRGLIFDEALGVATILLHDPEGNVIQIFGKSTGPFDATVKVSPDFTPGQ